MSHKDKNSASLLGKTVISELNCKSTTFFENLAQTQGNDCWLTSAEAARFLRISTNALRIMVHRRKIHYYYLGRRLRFGLTDLLNTPTLSL